MHGSKAKNAILSYGWPEPLQGGERVSLLASAFGSGPNLLIVLESLPAHIPDWINSTAAWVFGSSALESVGRCAAATSDDCSLMGSGESDEATTCLILPLSHYVRQCISSLAFRQRRFFN
jgi:hypothetical protein